MRNEYEGTQKIRQALEHSTLKLEANIVSRLADARNIALDQQAATFAKLSLAGVGLSLGNAMLPHTRRLMAIVGLTLGIVGTYYWNSFDQADENEEIDSALLADDLPVAAYTDQGFQAWLDHSAQSAAQ